MDPIKKEKFYQQYIDAFISNEGLDEAYAFKEKFLPEILYRYRRPNFHTLEEISSGLVRLAPSCEQNDPHDTTLKVDFSLIANEQSHFNRENYLNILKPPASAEELIVIRSASNIFRGVLEVMHKRWPELARKKNVLESIFEEKINEMEQIFSGCVQKGTLICSFSESHLIPHMWSNYAKDRQGICIAYPIRELDGKDPRRRYMFPISYDDIPFNATDDFLAKIRDPHRNNRIALCASMLKKISWSMEKEWRLISFEGRALKEKFIEMPKPSCIYLGEEIDKEYEKKVRELALENSIRIEFVSNLI